MSYPHLYTLLGSVLILFGVIEGGWMLLLAWFGCDFFALAIAHAKGWHGVFGKRRDGTLPLWSRLLFFPLQAYNAIFWHLVRFFRREPARNAITEDLVMGRRLLSFELDDEFENYLDLTGEYAEPRAIRRSASYRCFPILDGGAPTPEALREAVNSLRPGRTYIHCAQGHGRAGLFTLAVLLDSGLVRNVEDGFRMLKAIRPGIHLSQEQRRCIQAFAIS